MRPGFLNTIAPLMDAEKDLKLLSRPGCCSPSNSPLACFSPLADPPPHPRQRHARAHRHHGCQGVEQDIRGVEHTAGQEQLNALVERSDQCRCQDGQEGGYGDASPLAGALGERFIYEQGHHGVLEEMAALRKGHAGKQHEVDRHHAQRQADLGAAGLPFEPLRHDGHPDQEHAKKEEEDIQVALAQDLGQ